MSAVRRILYYNWVDYLDAANRGGGVTLYQRNVMQALYGRDDVEAAFLSAGLSYDLPARSPRWEPLRHGDHSSDAPRFEIINSGVLAPAHHSFGDPAQLSHPATRDTFFDFVESTGPYDVIHFNNLEGLPADVLEIKQRYPEMQIILSLHNYYPICPQVNLWFDERETCEDFKWGARCLNCLPHQRDGRMLRVAGGVSYRLRRAGLQPGAWTYEVALRTILRVGRSSLGSLRALKSLIKKQPDAPVLEPHIGAARAASFAARRTDMMALINTHCDRVLCVSDAVRVLAERYGIDPAITQTNYIGTRAAELFEQTSPTTDDLPKPTLTLGFLGYMRRDKGFFFLLDALEALPAQIAARVHIVIAARAGDSATMARVSSLKEHLAGVTHRDGYTHAELDALLAQVDVGVVPVLWHDNLPQVAIEMHARHIPLLTADMGGAPELGNCPDMVFTAGDTASFATRIAALVGGQVDMEAYWRYAMTPVDMPSHITELLDIYSPRP